MAVYLIFYFLCILHAFVPAIYNSKQLNNIFLFAIALFICFGYTTGSDWRQYETVYGYFDVNPLIGLVSYEPGYILYSFFYYLLGFKFWHFFIITKILIFVSLVKGFRKYYSYNDNIPLLFFICAHGLFLFIDNPMRNLIAIAIATYSLQYLEQRNLKKFLILVFLSATFHVSSIFLLVLYPIYRFKVSNKSLIVIYCLFYFILPVIYENLIHLLISIFSNVSFIADKLDGYFISGDSLENNTLFSFGSLAHLIYFVYLIKNRATIESNKHGRLVFYLSFVYLLLYRFATIVPIIYRFQLYLALFFAISVGLIIRNINKRTLFMYCVVMFQLTFFYFNTITSSYKYIPYTHYFQFINKDLSFEQRSEYNFINSPYNK